MKRSRVLLICLLLALLTVPVIWKLADAKEADSRTPRSASTSATASGDLNAADKDEGKTNRRPVDFAAKAKSMLELRAGELGILPIPDDFIDDIPGESAAGGEVPLLGGMVHKELARQLLEKALRQGAPIQVKVGTGKEGIGWKSEKLGVTARLGGSDASFPELQIESSEEDGTMTKMGMQLAAGTCAVVRYPSGQSVLVVVGGNFPIGGVRKEKEE